MSNERLYLDQAGYEDYLQRVSSLEEALKSFNATRSVEAKSILLDERYITHESSDLVRREKSILEELKDLRDKQYRIDIIGKHGDETKADIGDTLQLEIMYAPDDVEEITIELVATIGTSYKDLHKVSINSPLGKAIYGTSIGGISSYRVDDRKMSVHIVRKLVLEDKPIERS